MNEILLKRNLNALKKVNPFLHKWMTKDQKKDPDWFTPIRANNDDWNFLVNHSCHVDPAYDMKSPRRQSKRSLKPLKFLNRDVSVLVGAGAGHLLRLILDKKEKEHKVLIVEPVAEILLFAFSIYDFSIEIEDYSLLICNDNLSNLQNMLSVLDQAYVVTNWFMMIEKYCMLRPEYSDVVSVAKDTINQLRCNVGTVMGAGSTIAVNDIRNLPYIIRHRGVDELKNFYKNKPAILVSTGPSLAKNILQIKEAEGRVIVIAVAQALRILLAHDITPDFICTVDYGEVNYSHFEGLLNCTDIPLVALNRSYYKIIKDWRGPKFITANQITGYHDTAVGLICRKGGCQSGGSVSHLCFGFAVKLGCNPIIMTGQDLGYEGDRSHVVGHDAAGKITKMSDGTNNILDWEVDDPRSDIAGHHCMGDIVWAEGYFGGKVATNMGLFSFKTSFEGMIRDNNNIKIINSTEGGVKIKGARQMTLKKAVDDYCQKEIDKSKIKPLLSLADDWVELIDKAIPRLKRDIKNLNVIIDHAKKGLKIGRQMLVIGLNYKEIRDLIIENTRVSMIAEDAAKKDPLVSVAIYKASRRIFSKELYVEDKGTPEEGIQDLCDNRKHLRTRVKRNKLILDAAKKEASKLKTHYRTTLNLLKEYKVTGDEELIANTKIEEINLDDSDKYFALDNWVYPYISARIKLKLNPNDKQCLSILEDAGRLRTIELNRICCEYKDRSDIIEYNNLVEGAAEAGREHRNFDKAFELLEEAQALMPEESAAKWGYATCLHHLGYYERSIEAYERLVEQFPDNKRFRFELGNVTLIKDAQKGLEILACVMKETDEFDSHLSDIAKLHMMKKQYHDAIELYNKYLKSHPYDYMTLDELTKCYEHIGDKKSARRAKSRSGKIKIKGAKKMKPVK